MNKNKKAKINWYLKIGNNALKCRGDFNRPFCEGITLISLVITIVVMLILAGVAISITVGENDLFGHAQNATEKWDTAIGKESNSLLGALGILDENTGGTKKGDVKLSYTISNTSTGKQINLRMDIVDVPEIDYSSEMYDNFKKNEFLAGKTIGEILVLGGEIMYPGMGLTEEQVYDGVLKDELGKTYTEFMADPNGIIKEKYGYDTAEEYAKEYILQGFTGYPAFVIGSYAADIMYSKQLLPELVGKEEEEIKSIVEGYYKNEKTLDQIVAEVDGAETFDEAVAKINEDLGITSQGGYVISREQVLRVIAAKAYTATSLVVTKPDNTVQKVNWYDYTYKTITYPVTDYADYTFKVLAPSGRSQEITYKYGIIELDKQEMTASIRKGKEGTQSLTAILTNLEESELVWTTSDENIAQIEGKGATVDIKLKEAGTATITATCGENIVTCNVTVTYGVSTLELDKQEIKAALEDGQEITKELIATLTYLEENELVWTSSDENIAQIEGTGTTVNVKIKSTGTATITATCEEYSTTCRITVIKKVVEYVTEGTRKAPIPGGYTASKVSTEDEISEGLVIYQTDAGQSAVEGEPNSDAHKVAMETRNQYVWIPVDDINDMVMCKKNGTAGTGGSTCKLVYDVSSNEITCQTHGYTTSTELSDDSTSPNFIDTIGLAGRVYVTGFASSGGTYTINMAFTQASKDAHRFKANSTEADSTYREPDLVTGYDNSNYGLVLNELSQALGSANALKHQLNNKFIEMAKSVAKYGGFYISRFEPSYENSKVISKKNKTVLTAAASSSGNYIAGDKWYGLYNKTLNNVEKCASVNSHMIWGCQYDQVIKFLGTEAQTGHTYQTKSQVVTGYAGDQDILNNIYDLEGNNYEWTAQARDTYRRVHRGGDYDDADSDFFYPASLRSDYLPTVYGSNGTTRSTLYVAL